MYVSFYTSNCEIGCEHSTSTKVVQELLTNFANYLSSQHIVYFHLLNTFVSYLQSVMNYLRSVMNHSRVFANVVQSIFAKYCT